MTVANSTTYNGNTATYKAFCFNCHDPGFASDNTVFHKSPAGRTGSIHVDVPCQGCHAVVQHGGPRPGMLIAPSGVNGNGTIGVPLYSDWDTAAPYGGAVSRGLYMYSYPAAGSTWGSGPCGCNGSTHG